MIKIEIELPDATERKARSAGLLTSEVLDWLLKEELKKRKQPYPPPSSTESVLQVRDSAVERPDTPMASITVSLPDDLAQQAQAAGLLRPAALETLLREAMKRRDIDKLFVVIDKLNALEPALTEQEIDAEIEAARSERAGRR